jgi:AcrR family transcriptional regulator
MFVRLRTDILFLFYITLLGNLTDNEMGHIERRQKEKEEIRKRIMDSALNIAVAEGWNAVTIRRIADTIEYTPPIVYEYFENKEDLLNELRLMGQRKLYASYDSVIRSELDPKKSLLLIAGKHWDFAFQNKQLYQLMFNFDKPVQNPDMGKIIIQHTQLFYELTKDMELAEELLFDWICLMNGFIFNIMQMGVPPGIKKSPKVLYLNAADRFLKNITVADKE